jgi:uncharacterized protein
MPSPTDASRPANRLAGETSPYLLQHAHNPVDWYPWGPEALSHARGADRPIFLSVGYAACHWCHVMERESFEDPATAADLARWFVAIKVDREERPDIDAIYMDAVQAMTGQGGWPMSVFLTPDAKPFFGGTYFPDQPRHGLPSFRQVLAGVNQAWTERRDDVVRSAEGLAAAIAQGQAGPATAGARAAAHEQDHDHDGSPGAEDEGSGRLVAPTDQPGSGGPGIVGPTGAPLASPAAWGAGTVPLRTALGALEVSFDARHGGWGGAPKFPQAMALELLLREAVRTGGARPLAMVRRSLDAMAAGGIYDHLGGGFARYATDAGWLVPHFEKMLYDNALLARVYLHAWQVTGEPRYAAVVRETLDWAARELRVPAGGAFASSLDADTLGIEGATYAWTAEEIRGVLGASSPLFEAAYGVTANGNWEGQTILSRVRDDAALATTFGISRDEAATLLAQDRASLLAARGGRPQPGRDDKVLASWNGLMLAAYAEAGRFLPDGARYTAIAREAAAFLLGALRSPDGRLKRSWKEDRALHAGVLEDHTHLADGLLALYETTFDERWFTAARELADLVLARFAAPDGGFFDTADDAETLIARPRGLQDNALPSGNAMAASVLLRLAAWTGEGRYRSAAETAVEPMATLAARYPTGFAQWLVAYQLALAPIDEVAVVGDPDAAETAALLAVVRRGHRPWQVVAAAADAGSSAVPLLVGRVPVDGRPTAYVCRGLACRQPVTDPAALAAQLGGRAPG